MDPRSVLDVLDRAVVVTDTQGRILLWNDAAEQLYGWAESEVIGRSVLDVLAPPSDVETNARDLDSIARGSAMSGDRLVRRRDGTQVLIRTSTAPMFDDNGDVIAIVGSSEDVADRRRTEQRARDLAEHFRSALEAGGLGTWRWNMATGETIWDERLERLFGLEPGGFDGRFDSYVELLHPEDRDDVVATLNRAVESKTPYRVEHRVVHPDGSERWIAGVGGVTLDEHGNVTGTVGCSMDITRRVHQEAELRRLAQMAEASAERERLQRERLEFLTAINEALGRSSSVAAVMRNVTRQAVPRLGDWCAMHLLPADGRGVPEVEIAHVDPAMVRFARELQERFPYDPDAPTGVAAVIRTGVTEFYPEITPEALAESGELPDEVVDLIRQLEIGSAITVALEKRGRVLGALQFVASTSARPYTSDDVALAKTVASRIAASVQNLRLREEQRDMARTLQRSLLPASIPDVPGLDVAVRYWPNGQATEVGGDFFDLFALDRDGVYAMALGDVCGTGPAAAALTGLARHTIRDSAWHDDSHHEVLRSLNRAVRRSGQNTFLTCVYATILGGPGPLTLTVCPGGHPLPTLVTRTAGSALGRPGTLIGLLDEIDVETTSIDLEPGDVVVFHTDGATDVEPPHALDDAQWTDLVTDAVRRGGCADAIADHIRDSLEAILPFESRDDDIALLVLAVPAGTD